jgi:hypothetical protein
LPEPVLGVDALARDAVLDPTHYARIATPAVVVALVGVQLLGPTAGPPASPRPDRHDGVEQRLHHAAVVHVGRGHRDRERDALPVDQEVVLATRLALVGRVRSDGGSPLFAAKLRLSRLARVQSIRAAAARRSSMS